MQLIQIKGLKPHPCPNCFTMLRHDKIYKEMEDDHTLHLSGVCHVCGEKWLICSLPIDESERHQKVIGIDATNYLEPYPMYYNLSYTSES